MLQPLQDPSRRFFDQVVAEPSYIIFQEAGKIFAKNGRTGQIDLSGTDASTVIQSAINTLEDGGRIFIKAGRYLMRSKGSFGEYPYALLIYDKSYIELLGEPGAILRMDDNQNTNLIYIHNSSNIKISGLCFDGNKANNPDVGSVVNKSNAIVVRVNSSHITISDNTFYNVKGHAVITRCSAGYGYINVVFNYFRDNDWFDIAFDTATSYSLAYGNKIYNSCGIETFNYAEYNSIISNVIVNSVLTNYPAISPVNTTLIKNNIIISCPHVGIYFGDDKPAIAEGNVIFDTPRVSGFPFSAIYLAQGSKNKIIANNILIGNGRDSGIVVRGNDNLICGNYITGFIRYGILDFTVSGNRYIGNRVFSNGLYDIRILDSTNALIKDNNVSGSASTYKISVTGTRNIVKNNLGYITENYGTATIPAGNTYVDVPHGLAITPDINRIKVTPKDDLGGRGFWVSNVTSTTFRINISSADTVDHSFGWSYE